MQDPAKRAMFYHDLDKDAKINHVLDKGSMYHDLDEVTRVPWLTMI